MRAEPESGAVAEGSADGAGGPREVVGSRAEAPKVVVSRGAWRGAGAAGAGGGASSSPGAASAGPRQFLDQLGRGLVAVARLLGHHAPQHRGQPRRDLGVTQAHVGRLGLDVLDDPLGELPPGKGAEPASTW